MRGEDFALIDQPLVDLLHPPPALQAAAASADSLVPPVYMTSLLQNSFDIDCPTLLQANWKPGSNMMLKVFCATYQLDDAIRDRFKEHCYKHARMLHYLTIKDMEGMKFGAGEITEVPSAKDHFTCKQM